LLAYNVRSVTAFMLALAEVREAGDTVSLTEFETQFNALSAQLSSGVDLFVEDASVVGALYLRHVVRRAAVHRAPTEAAASVCA
jgi:hypothetical protein